MNKTFINSFIDLFIQIPEIFANVNFSSGENKYEMRECGYIRKIWTSITQWYFTVPNIKKQQRGYTGFTWGQGP